MSVLPVKQPLPTGIVVEPVTISLPYLVHGGDAGVASGDETESGARLVYSPYQPLPRGRTSTFMGGEKFGEISRWRFRVDRMGILKEPRVPVAWKGLRPYEVYFWTGREWARISRSRFHEPYDDILYRMRGDIAAIVSREGPAWDEADTPQLAAYASLWRYLWVGDIGFSDAERRAAERAGRGGGAVSQDAE
jgi:hypothetical protein